MKTKKKAIGTGNLNKIIQGGKAQVEQKTNKRRATYFLSEEILDLITQNCRGNKSFFIEEAVNFYLKNQKK